MDHNAIPKVTLENGDYLPDVLLKKLPIESDKDVYNMHTSVNSWYKDERFGLTDRRAVSQIIMPFLFINAIPKVTLEKGDNLLVFLLKKLQIESGKDMYICIPPLIA